MSKQPPTVGSRFHKLFELIAAEAAKRGVSVQAVPSADFPPGILVRKVNFENWALAIEDDNV